MDDDEKLEATTLDLHVKNIVRLRVLQVSIDDEQVVLLPLEVRHHLNNHFVTVPNVSANDQFQQFDDATSQQALGVFVGRLKLLHLGQMYELIGEFHRGVVDTFSPGHARLRVCAKQSRLGSLP